MKEFKKREQDITGEDIDMILKDSYENVITTSVEDYQNDDNLDDYYSQDIE
jgi:hypothetical protein